MRVTAKAERIYVCLGCSSRWHYDAIRNIARCPACGDGLARPRSSRNEPPPTGNAQLTAANCASTNASAAA